TVEDRHVGKQRSKIRLVYPQLLLHGNGRETDFATDETAAGQLPSASVCRLHGVRGFDIAMLEVVADRRHCPAGFAGLPKDAGDHLNWALCHKSGHIGTPGHTTVYAVIKLF